MQFKCKTCGHKFEAQEGEYVICPKCKSDNVGPFKPSPMKVVLPFLGVLIIAVGTFFVIQVVKKGKSEAPAQEMAAQQETVTTVTEKNADTRSEVKAEPAKVEPITLAVSDPSAPKKGKYSILAVAQNVPAGVKVKYQLMDSHIKTVKMESEDGKFQSVPASKEPQGLYGLAVVNAATGEILHSTVIQGYIKEQAVVKKMSKDELQSMINAQNPDLLTIHPKLSKTVALNFDNLKEDERKPVSFDAVFEKFIMEEWKSVKVTSVTYEKSGKINSVSMHIEHLEY